LGQVDVSILTLFHIVPVALPGQEHHTNFHRNLHFRTDQLVEEDPHHVPLECLKQGRCVFHASYSSCLLLESPLSKAPFSHSA
jgi:hypothetical protein